MCGLVSVVVGGRVQATIADRASVMFAACVQQYRDLLFASVGACAAVVSAALPVLSCILRRLFADAWGMHRRIGRYRIDIARDSGLSVVGPEILDAGVF